MNGPIADIRMNRKQKKWPAKILVARLMWAVVQPLFRYSPRLFWVWRVLLLRFFGAKLGKNVHVYPSVRIVMPWNLSVGDDVAIGERAIIYALGKIEIGSRSTISQYSHLCAGTHDYRSEVRTLITPPIFIGRDVWVAADAFIMPGVAVGDGAIVGARAVVTKDVTSGDIVVGNPAKSINAHRRDG